MTILETLRQSVAPPHPAGHGFVLAGGLAFVVGLLLAGWLAWIGAVFTLACLYFFRDPERVPPARAGLALAPADGRVVAIDDAVPPAELGLGDAPRPRVAIFLSVLDVHVNRMPVTGTVARAAYRHGKYLSASLDKASTDNERNALLVRLEDGREVVVVQIAGLVARRVLCDVHEGDRVQAGQRFGIIRFGSRTELYLPAGVAPLVAVGQTMVGGETVIADLNAG
jgi:phosphatidylserine decarboxylase